MTHLDDFKRMLEEQSPDGNSFFNLKGKYIARPDGKTNDGKECYVIRIPEYNLEFVFYDGVFKGIVKDR